MNKKELDAHYAKVAERVTERTDRTDASDCTCEDACAEMFSANPRGHYVSCPCWGTNCPNKNAVTNGTL